VIFNVIGLVYFVVLVEGNVNKCLTRCNYTQFILSVNCSTCFGWFLHPSSGAQITVSTASGAGQPLLLPVGIVEGLRLACIIVSTASGTGQPLYLPVTIVEELRLIGVYNYIYSI